MATPPTPRGVQPVCDGSITLTVIPSHELDACAAIDLGDSASIVELYLAGNHFARYLVTNRAPWPVINILRSVAKRWRAFAILEAPYLDLEFWNDHVGFYDRCFFRYQVPCERYHFFSWTVDKAAERARIEDLCDAFRAGLPWRDIQRKFGCSLEYRGYCVIRPTDSYAIGRTAIAFDRRLYCDVPDAAQEGMRPPEKDGRSYLPVHNPCSASLLGTRLSLETVEFIQQDPNLGPCGTACVWVATRSLSRRFDLNKYDYATITRQAMGYRRPIAVPDTSATALGLQPREIETAILQTGAQPLTIERNPQDSPDKQAIRLRQELYAFVEFGIPVLVFLNPDDQCKQTGHVMVAVGHSMTKYENVEKYAVNVAEELKGDFGELKRRHCLVSSFIPVYFAHDDSFGPFNRICFPPDTEQVDANPSDKEQAEDRSVGARLKRAAAAFIGETGTAKFPAREGAPSSQFRAPTVEIGSEPGLRTRYVHQLMISLPPLIRVRSYQPLVRAIQHFDNTGFADAWDPDTTFLWRSVLVEGAAFKELTNRRNFDKELVQWYANLMLPKYVWLYEVTAVPPGQFATAFDPTKPRDIHGEYLYDPTSSPHEQNRVAYRVLGTTEDYRADRKVVPRPGVYIYKCFQRDKRRPPKSDRLRPFAAKKRSQGARED